MEAKKPKPWDYYLRKYLLLLSTVVAAVTYAAGFNPPGGVWQDTDNAAGHIAGGPIILETNYLRYMVYFYCNAAAFVSSVVMVVLILLLALLNEKKDLMTTMMPLRVVMVLDLLSLMVAYAAGTYRDKFTVVYSTLLVAAVVVYLTCQVLLALWPTQSGSQTSPASKAEDEHHDQSQCKILTLLATFAVSITYVAGLSTPGGFWDHTDEEGHIAGDAILKELHEARLKAFLVCNTTAFVASLLTIVLLLGKQTLRSLLYGCTAIALVGLVGAYATGSTRDTRTTAYVLCLVVPVLVCMLLLRLRWGGLSSLSLAQVLP